MHRWTQLITQPSPKDWDFTVDEMRSLITFQELIQGMISVTHHQHGCVVGFPKILIGQQSLCDLEPHVGFSWAFGRSRVGRWKPAFHSETSKAILLKTSPVPGGPCMMASSLVMASWKASIWDSSRPSLSFLGQAPLFRLWKPGRVCLCWGSAMQLRS